LTLQHKHAYIDEKNINFPALK